MSPQDAPKRPPCLDYHVLPDDSWDAAKRIDVRLYIEHLEQHQKECPCLYLGAQTKTIEHLEAENRALKVHGEKMEQIAARNVDRIAELESIERNLRESCEILKAMDAEKNTRIAELEAEMDLAQPSHAIRTIKQQANRIAELERYLDDIATHDDDVELVPPAGEPGADMWLDDGINRYRKPPAALTHDEEEILRDPRPGKGVIVTEGYTPPPAEEEPQ